MSLAFATASTSSLKPRKQKKVLCPFFAWSSRGRIWWRHCIILSDLVSCRITPLTVNLPLPHDGYCTYVHYCIRISNNIIKIILHSIARSRYTEIEDYNNLELEPNISLQALDLKPRHLPHSGY